MKEIMEKIIAIIERNAGNQETTKKELEDYIDTNSDMIKKESNKMSEAVELAVKSVENPMDINGVMNAMFGTIAKFMGEENFNKMTELEQKYPFIKEITKKIMPQGNK